MTGFAATKFNFLYLTTRPQNIEVCNLGSGQFEFLCVLCGFSFATFAVKVF